jgi:hypothetical protein
MAHVVTKLPRITAFDPAATKIFPEPYDSKEEMKFELPELGEPWECFMFDVCIDPALQSATGTSSTKSRITAWLVRHLSAIWHSK